MTPPIYKVNDWVLYEFEIVQIKTMRGPNVTEVSTGFVGVAGSDLRIFSLTLNNKVISETFDDVSTQLHGLNDNHIPYPDLHRVLVELWQVALNAKEKDLQKVFDKLYDLRDKITELSTAHKNEFDFILLLTGGIM